MFGSNQSHVHDINSQVFWRTINYFLSSMKVVIIGHFWYLLTCTCTCRILDITLQRTCRFSTSPKNWQSITTLFFRKIKRSWKLWRKWYTTCTYNRGHYYVHVNTPPCIFHIWSLTGLMSMHCLVTQLIGNSGIIFRKRYTRYIVNYQHYRTFCYRSFHAN